MSKKTCGDIDGKPCEWHGKIECERHRDTLCSYPAGYLTGTIPLWACDEACAPMLAMVEACAEVSRLRRVEAAAKVWAAECGLSIEQTRALPSWDEVTGAEATHILSGLGPDGKAVEP